MQQCFSEKKVKKIIIARIYDREGILKGHIQKNDFPICRFLFARYLILIEFGSDILQSKRE